VPGPYICLKCGKEMWSLSEFSGEGLCRSCQPEGGVLDKAHPHPLGIVYLLKVGPHYKIGKTKDFAKRLDQISLQLPWPVEVIHKIETDDPDGIENYWHKRFSDKHSNGEWYKLSPKEVAVFTSRSTM